MNGPTEVYVVRFTGSGGFVFHKVGITGKSVTERFGWTPNGYDYCQLRRYVFPTRDEALRVEKRLLSHFRDQRPYRGLWDHGPLPSGNKEVIVAPESAILATADRLAGYRVAAPTTPAPVPTTPARPAPPTPGTAPPRRWKPYRRRGKPGRLRRWLLAMMVGLGAIFAWIGAPSTPTPAEREATATAQGDSQGAESPNAGGTALPLPAPWAVNIHGTAASPGGTLEVRCSPIGGEYAGILVDIKTGGASSNKLMGGGRVLVDGREVVRGPLATSILARRQGAVLARALAAGNQAEIVVGDGRRFTVALRGSAQAIAEATAGCS